MRSSAGTITEPTTESGLSLTGIADEAGRSIEGQIAAHRELGWSAIELRLIDGKNVAGELSEPEFEQAGDSTVPEGERYRSYLRYARAFERGVEDARGAPPQ